MSPRHLQLSNFSFNFLMKTARRFTGGVVVSAEELL
jgi:hypothetical protein